MKKDIILCGVGGDGIVSVAKIISDAALNENLYLKQSEIHGMSQRGGSVFSHLRLSSEPIFADVIPEGQADIILSSEPMEALRYLPWLRPDGTVVTASKPLVNIPDYPDEAALRAELSKLPQLVCEDIDAMAASAGNPRGANIALLGLAAPYIGILDKNALREAVKRVFAPKGEAIVDLNLKCYDLESA